MGRRYSFVFTNDAYDREEHVGSGNTRRSAERWARSKLRDKLKIENTLDWRVHSCTLVRE